MWDDKLHINLLQGTRMNQHSGRVCVNISMRESPRKIGVSSPMFFETNYTNHRWILNLLKWAMHDECSRMGDLFDWSSYQVIENLLYPVILAITKWRTKMLPLGHLGLSGDHSLGAWDIRDSPIEPRKKPSDTFHWILVVNRDPYNGLLSSPYNCVV